MNPTDARRHIVQTDLQTGRRGACRGACRGARCCAPTCSFRVWDGGSDAVWMLCGVGFCGFGVCGLDACGVMGRDGVGLVACGLAGCQRCVGPLQLCEIKRVGTISA